MRSNPASMLEVFALLEHANVQHYLLQWIIAGKIVINLCDGTDVHGICLGLLLFGNFGLFTCAAEIWI